MIRAFGLALAQLGDPRILRVLALTLALTLLVFAGIGVGLERWLAGGDICADLSDELSCAIGPDASVWASLLLTLAALWFLFPAVAIGVASAFSDRIVQAVEMRHYPEAAAHARRPGWLELGWLGLASGLRLLLYNLVALPFYLLLLVTGIGPLILFAAVNAVALGRDLPELVAVRHLDPVARRHWLGATRPLRWLMGLAVTGLFMVPLANLLAPVLGAAMATHIFHGTRDRR